jgi:hypothetical protein
VVIYGALIAIDRDIDLISSNISYTIDVFSNMQNICVYSNFLFTEKTSIYPVIEMLWKVTLSIKEYSHLFSVVFVLEDLN